MSAESFINAMQALHDIAGEVAVPMKGGKTYVMVKDRIEIFRREFGDSFGIDTKLDYSDGFDQGAAVVAHAHITDREGFVIASGWAVEFVGSTKLTDASPVEVAETSAIGRALACFGLLGGEYASLNEMETHQRKEAFRGDGQRHPAPNRNPSLDRQVQRNSRPSSFYVPTDHDAVWLQPEVEMQKIIEEIDNISTTHELGRYWSELKPAITIFKSEQVGMDMIAEIKAAFATRHNLLGAQR
jgi:hypothetical protein